MTKKQIDRLIRLKTVRQRLKRSHDLWSGNLAIENSVEDLAAEIIFLDTVLQMQQQGSKPVTIGKLAGRQRITNKIRSLAGSLSTYAGDQDDAELRNITALFPSRIKGLRDDNFLVLLQNLLDRANLIGGDVLTEYNFDQDTLDELSGTIETLQTMLRQPRITMGQLSAMRKQVPLRLNKAREILFHQLRNLIAPYAETQPVFVQEFEESLKIIDSGGKKDLGATADDLGKDTTA